MKFKKINFLLVAFALNAGPLFSQCSDGIDNDGDGLVDWQYDLGCTSQNDMTEGGVASESLDNGWTVFEKSPDTRIVYVSDSVGNDAWTGLCPDAPTGGGTCGPRKSLSEGASLLRDTFPDWLLLRRGDTWVNQGWGGWAKSGRSIGERMVIGSYGNSTVRPKLETNSGFNIVGNRYIDFMAMVDLHFARLSPEGNPGAVFLLGGTHDFLFENIYIERFGGNLGCQEWNGRRSFNLVIRRSIIVDSYSTDEAHSAGSYLDGVDGLLLDETFYDHNGWSETIPQATPPTQFRRNIYIQTNTRNVVARKIITARSASEGAQFRSGGVVENSLFLKNSGNSHSYTHPPQVGSFRMNVIMGSRDIHPGEVRGIGIEIQASQLDFSNNIIAHGGDEPATANVRAIALSSAESIAIEGNVVYNWFRPGDPGVAMHVNSDMSAIVRNNAFQMNSAGRLINLSFSGSPAQMSFEGNRYYSQNSGPFNWGESYATWLTRTGETGSSFAQAAFPEPSRSISTYMQTLGQTPTLEAFLAEARLQSKWNWRPQYTAEVVNDYIRGGFGVGPYVPVNRAPVVSAGPNQTVATPGTTATLAGVVGDDGLPNPPAQVTSVWSLVSGPGTVTFENAVLPNTTATFSQPGTYVLRLTANDSALSYSDELRIVIGGATGGETPNAPVDGGETRVIPCMDPSNPNHQANIPICVNSRTPERGTIVIYSKRGTEVRTLSMDLSVGRNQIEWNGEDASGRKVASGLYFARIKIGDAEFTVKVPVIK